jgi:hypothetical protein
MPRKKKIPTLEERVEILKREAEAKGLLNNLLYQELLDDFVYQTNLMRRLRAEIDNGELTTQKTYIKNNPNTSPNKLIATYNATSNARVNTVAAIAKVVKNFNGEESQKDEDPLLKIMSGGDLENDSDNL